MTNFPNSVDSFTNPVFANQINSTGVPHADQHTNLNDAVLAIENFLLNGVLPAGSDWRPKLVSGAWQWQVNDRGGGGTPWHRVYAEIVEGQVVLVIDQTGQA